MGARAFPILAHFSPQMLVQGTFENTQRRKATHELNEVRVGPTVFLVLAHVMWLERNMHCLHYLRLLRSYFAHVLVVPSLGQQCCIL